MAEKKEKTFTRIELAEYLESLSGQLRKGKLDAAGREWTIPEKFPVKTQFKEKKGRIVTKLSWRWSTLGDYKEEARQEIDRWKESVKTVKRRLAGSYRQLNQDVARGVFPDEKILSDFVEDSKKFAEFAEPDWEEAMAEYMDHLTNLELAAKSGQLDALTHELRDLGYRMKACHREFK